LIDTAINIHSRALEAQKQQQWYKPLAFQAAAALVGALVGSWSSVYFIDGQGVFGHNGIEGRPVAAYRASNSGDIRSRAWSAMARIARNGWFFLTRLSGER
jgi:hypothetical protein